MKKCDSCGKLYQETKDVFCPHCGAVAQKECNHAPAYSTQFDQSRWNRMDAYSMAENEARHNADMSTNPHTSRETAEAGDDSYRENVDPYNPFGKKWQNTPSVFDDTPKATTKSNKKSTSPVAIIIALVVVFNVLFGVAVGFFSEYTEDSYYYEETPELWGEFDADTYNATVEAEYNDETSEYDFVTIKLKNLYFKVFGSDNIEIIKLIQSESYYCDAFMFPIAAPVISGDEFWDSYNASDYYCSNDYSYFAQDGYLQFSFNTFITEGEIVAIEDCVIYIGDDCIPLYVTLPFDAFSVEMVDDETVITYYRKSINTVTEQYEYTAFEPYTDVNTLEGYSYSLDFSTGETDAYLEVESIPDETAVFDYENPPTNVYAVTDASEVIEFTNLV